MVQFDAVKVQIRDICFPVLYLIVYLKIMFSAGRQTRKEDKNMRKYAIAVAVTWAALAGMMTSQFGLEKAVTQTSLGLAISVLGTISVCVFFKNQRTRVWFVVLGGFFFLGVLLVVGALPPTGEATRIFFEQLIQSVFALILGAIALWIAGRFS